MNRAEICAGISAAYAVKARFMPGFDLVLCCCWDATKCEKPLICGAFRAVVTAAAFAAWEPRKL